MTTTAAAPARSGADGVEEATLRALRRAAAGRRAGDGPVLCLAADPAEAAALAARRQGTGREGLDGVDGVRVLDTTTWALRLLAWRGVPVVLDEERARSLFVPLLDRSLRLTALGTAAEPSAGWWGEVTGVLRALTAPSYAAYAATGTGAALRPAQSQALWALHVALTNALAGRGLTHAAGAVHLALAEVRRAPLRRPYSAVVLHGADGADPVQVALARALTHP